MVSGADYSSQAATELPALIDVVTVVFMVCSFGCSINAPIDISGSLFVNFYRFCCLAALSDQGIAPRSKFL